ncbi:hypothetical protein diail_6373 [Diaporthe ilicicola]|nr:hypothetical protein diail_6373 [Diaporthe ilicicola]
MIKQKAVLCLRDLATRDPSSPPLSCLYRVLLILCAKGIILYSYFAKLQLNSLAIRARKEFVNLAISAAASILTFAIEEEDTRRALVGTPLYVHTMIAFACAFPIKGSTMWSRVTGLSIEADYVTNLLGRVVLLLKTSVTSDRHCPPPFS